MLGIQDGTNTVFQIPTQRVVVWNAASWSTLGSIGTYNLFPQIYKNSVPMLYGTTGAADYVILDPINSIVKYQNSKQPVQADNMEVTFNYTWMTDVEIDGHMDHAATEIGFSEYFTIQDLTDPNINPPPMGSTLPSDIPDALMSAIVMLGTSFAARALALRFSTRYDTSAGDQSWSPSQMAQHFKDLADSLEKQGYTARDDFYKGQSRQYEPAIGVNPSTSAVGAGFVLPNWTPPR